MFLVLLFVFIISIITIFFLSQSKNKPAPVPPLLTPIPTPSLTLPAGGKINISGVLVNNFFLSAKETTNRGDILIKDQGLYQFVYFSPENKFLISILSSPFSEVRSEAEGDFLKFLGVSQPDACRLGVDITTPYFANPDYAGTIYRLSFCENKQ